MPAEGVVKHGFRIKTGEDRPLNRGEEGVPDRVGLLTLRWPRERSLAGAEERCGATQRWHRAGKAVKRMIRKVGWRLSGRGALGFLDRIPGGNNVGGGEGLGVGEDVRVTTDEFAIDVFVNIFEEKLLSFLGDLGMEGDLEQEIAQFLREVAGIAGVDGIERFVRLLDDGVAERGVGLLAIPGTPFGRPEVGNDSLKHQRRAMRREGGKWGNEDAGQVI